jgi:uncharacterized protein (DUF169 family)
MTDDSTDARELGSRLVEILGLSRSPVGVRFLGPDDSFPAGSVTLKSHRFCQALMKARSGVDVLLDAEGIACPAAASAFGFKPLPPGLESGKGLVGFGIIADEAVGRRMFEGMSRLEPGSVKALHIFPLDKADYTPEVVVVEDQVEKLMWLALAYLRSTGGERIEGSTAVLQATCVDCTVIPYLENRMNLSYGCYGCRDATDISPDETVLGFPADFLPAIVDNLEHLSTKAIPASRSKGALANLGSREAGHAEESKGR